MSDKQKSAERTIFNVFIALAILTGIEYYVGVAFPSPALLMILAFLKTILIVNFFMHVYRLWREEPH